MPTTNDGEPSLTCRQGAATTCRAEADEYALNALALATDSERRRKREDGEKSCLSRQAE